LGELSLLSVEAVEVICAQFKRCRHMQKVGGPSTQFGGRLSRQFACAFKDRVWQPTELENPVAQIILEVGYRFLGLRSRNFLPKDPQSESIDDFEFSQSSNNKFSRRSLHRACGSGAIGIRAVQ
jgi:hypothetical protein